MVLCSNGHVLWVIVAPSFFCNQEPLLLNEENLGRKNEKSYKKPKPRKTLPNKTADSRFFIIRVFRMSPEWVLVCRQGERSGQRWRQKVVRVSGSEGVKRRVLLRNEKRKMKLKKRMKWDFDLILRVKERDMEMENDVCECVCGVRVVMSYLAPCDTHA
ncbi:hypothetical protein VNO77_02235 [Canavalia gladiata]|uniref:Uncharacterized protein n=1 Tax=Canavalia gladiata TaxID=3824 RepID=A0AAN9MT92_CANGL